MTLSDTQVSENTLSAFFDLRENAERALERLRGKGIAEAQLRLTEGQGGYSFGAAPDAAPAEHRGFFEALADFFFPDPDRAAYAEGLSRGGYLVTVLNLPEDHWSSVLDILDGEGAVNIDERVATWQSEGWIGSHQEQVEPAHADTLPTQPGFAAAVPGYAPDATDFPRPGDRSASADERGGISQPRGRFAESLNDLPETSPASEEALGRDDFETRRKAVLNTADESDGSWSPPAPDGEAGRRRHSRVYRREL